MQQPPRQSSLFLRGGVAVVLVVTSLLAGCDKPREPAATGAMPPASAASR